ncbi:glutamine-hydrolyzing GMP synthase [Coprothermobacter platensis]|uniref:glutamine-hydrolyzing GMP synthase n=1 Tax=Coprothermobacter platensis TaxID=108819 RepID=UPI00036FB25E|nr:glutamine-hydrolyzing GMP synthase [Coprothermobacter platensis]
MKRDGVAVIDFGGQYAHLISRRIRDLGVYAEIVPFQNWKEVLIDSTVKAVVLSGGPASVYETDAPELPEEFFKIVNKPVLGICYGAQLIAQALGGTVGLAEDGEYGRTRLVVNKAEPLFIGTPEQQDVWMSHGDQVLALPSSFNIAASTDNCKLAAFQKEPNLYAVQFHPEVAHTTYGKQILENFVFNVAKIEKNWNVTDYVGEAIKEIREIVGENGMVLGALSGGVDSAVACVLTDRALGGRLQCFYIDTGLQRADDEAYVRHLSQHLGLKLKVVNAKSLFLSALDGVVDPEEKRKIIGSLFIKVFEQEASALGHFDFLLQGTLYPDVVESGGGAANVIKSHHNVGGLPERLGLKLLEPLRWLYKDEVRNMGKWLGIPEDFLMRHPFPGPGLAVRIVGPVKEEYLDISRRADRVLERVLKEEGVYSDLWQAFPVFTGVKSVGVKGDARHYGWVMAVRMVQSVDAMTADWYRADPELLEKIASTLISEIPELSRVVYDITSKPPGTIEWE